MTNDTPYPTWSAAWQDFRQGVSRVWDLRVGRHLYAGLQKYGSRGIYHNFDDETIIFFQLGTMCLSAFMGCTAFSLLIAAIIMSVRFKETDAAYSVLSILDLLSFLAIYIASISVTLRRKWKLLLAAAAALGLVVVFDFIFQVFVLLSLENRGRFFTLPEWEKDFTLPTYLVLFLCMLFKDGIIMYLMIGLAMQLRKPRYQVLKASEGATRGTNDKKYAQ